MPILQDSSVKTFDRDAVHKGDLIRAKHKTWPEPRNGIVATVKDSELTVLFLPGLGNVSNYFVIAASEVDAELWALAWTTDLETVNKEGELNDP